MRLAQSSTLRAADISEQQTVHHPTKDGGIGSMTNNRARLKVLFVNNLMLTAKIPALGWRSIFAATANANLATSLPQIRITDMNPIFQLRRSYRNYDIYRLSVNRVARHGSFNKTLLISSDTKRSVPSMSTQLLLSFSLLSITPQLGRWPTVMRTKLTGAMAP